MRAKIVCQESCTLKNGIIPNSLYFIFSHVLRFLDFENSPRALLYDLVKRITNWLIVSQQKVYAQEFISSEHRSREFKTRGERPVDANMRSAFK